MSDAQPPTPVKRSADLRWLACIGAGAVGLVLGWVGHWAFQAAHDGEGAPASTQGAGETAQRWVCAMNFNPHPYYSSDKPGNCGYCGMALTLDVSDTGDPGRTVLSESAVQRMDVQTAVVERKAVAAEIRLVGKVDYDETRLATITAWVPGRLDRLFVDYTGVPVRKGDHMLEMYSPKLITAQTGLLAAAKAVGNLGANASPDARRSAEENLQAAREKLSLWGLTEKQITEIERSSTPSDRVTIYSPIGGIVIDKQAEPGTYVKEGAKIYTIADLSEVWVKLSAYESDLMWLRYGQEVTFTSVAAPGEEFTGTIAFISPVVDAPTRSVKVRVNAANPRNRLKPGMFVKAIVKATLNADGKVTAPSLAGKWICPMHPAVVKDAAGQCDVCEMDLLTAKELGYALADADAGQEPLVIPATAPLITGKRAVVYIRAADQAKPTFEWREIKLGPRAGEHYVVLDGLDEGERVVTRGNFAIDSERQLQARPSMLSQMTSPTLSDVRIAISPAFRRQLDAVFAGYFGIQKALAGDSLDEAIAGVKATSDALLAVNADGLAIQHREEWTDRAGKLQAALARAAAEADLQTVREQFELLSRQMIAVARRYGPPGEQVHVLRCPMAFDNRGADWLQVEEGTRNPYFGASMLSCGGVTETIWAAGHAEDHAHD